MKLRFPLVLCILLSALELPPDVLSASGLQQLKNESASTRGNPIERKPGGGESQVESLPLSRGDVGMSEADKVFAEHALRASVLLGAVHSYRELAVSR